MRGLIDKRSNNIIENSVSFLSRSTSCGKRGAAHFEIIFSFVFFVGFVTFLFIVLKPQDTSTLSSSVITELYDSFEQEAQTNLSSIFLKANYTKDVDCFNIILPGNIFTYTLGDSDSYITTLARVGVDSNLVVSGIDGDLNINNDAEFFRVSISPEFEDGSIKDCDYLEDYELGSIIEREVISYSALENMRERYYNGSYEDLKTDLKVPFVFDFAIVPENMSDIVMEPRSGIPDSVEVQARDYVVEVLDKNGRLSNERFTFKVW